MTDVKEICKQHERPLKQVCCVWLLEAGLLTMLVLTAALLAPYLGQWEVDNSQPRTKISALFQ